MKKIVSLFAVFVLVLTTSGCSMDVKRIDNKSVNEIVDTVFSQKKDLKNVSLDGYTYYLPKGVQLINKRQYNSILKKDQNMMYLYVDVISYYHKVENHQFVVNSNAYLSRKIMFNKNSGYLEINQIDGKYFVEFMYNYAKIEAYVELDQLESITTDMATILSSIQFNDTILETIVGEHVLDYREETFNIFEPTREEDAFLKYVEESEKKNKEDIENEDHIDIDKETE